MLIAVQGFKMLYDKNVLLMCRPNHYTISGPDGNGNFANDFAKIYYEEYKKDPKALLNRATRQWMGYKIILEYYGATIIELEPKEGCGDQVFTADPTLSLVGPDGAVTITSKFSNTERQIEVPYSVDIVQTLFPDRKIVNAEYNTEGTGDNYYDPFRDLFWSGYTENPGRRNAAAGRSDINAHRYLESITGVRVIDMAVKEPFFHVDTCMAPLQMGHIIAYKKGMQPEAYEKLLEEGFARYKMKPEDYLISVSDEDAIKYACNVRCIGDNTLIMPMVSDELQRTLTLKGYKVICSDVSEFIKDGGAMHCLTNNLNEQRIPGGTCVKFGFKAR